MSLQMVEDEALQHAGAAVINSLFSLSRALKLYDSNNAAVVRIIDELQAGVDGWFTGGEPALQVRVLSGEAFVNGRLLKVDPTLYDRVNQLYGRLMSAQFNELTFLRGVRRAELEDFARDLSVALRMHGVGASREDRPHLRLGTASGDAIASFRFDPDRLAVWLYRSLLDLVDQLYEQVGRGAAPSLLPLRRNLQLVLDSMRQHAAIFQWLAALQEPAQAPTLAARRVTVAIELMSLAQWMGLPPTELLVLGLAGVLGGLAREGDPDQAVRALLRFSGLGDAAVPLTLIIHDAARARRGQEAELPGQALALVEAWVDQVSARPDRPARSAHAVLQHLASKPPPGLSSGLVAALVRCKGPYPLGSMLALEPGGFAIVLGTDGVGGGQRPIVIPLDAQGFARPVLDLGKHPEIQVVSAPPPASTPLSPARLVEPDAAERVARAAAAAAVAAAAVRSGGREEQAPGASGTTSS